MKTNTVRIRVEKISGGFNKTYPVIDGKPIFKSNFIVTIDGKQELCTAFLADQRNIGMIIVTTGYFIKHSDGESIQIQDGIEAILV